MQTATVGGVKLEFETCGAGEPVVLIHGSAIADSHVPLMKEHSLSRFRLVRYRRRGYGGSTRSAPPVTIGLQAGDCISLMRHLGIERAHVVGHSYGGVIALQVALDFPQAVHSLSLLEPALLRLAPSAGGFLEGFARAAAKYEGGDKAGALEGFMKLVNGPNWREAADAVAGAREMGIADVGSLFDLERPAIQQWTFDREHAGRIKQPLLAMVGAESELFFREVHEAMVPWFPQAEPMVIEGATHMLQMVRPRAVAEGLAGFFARHPISA